MMSDFTIDWDALAGFLGDDYFENMSGDRKTPTRFEMATMSGEELAEFFGQDVEGFNTEEFMTRFGRFIPQFDDRKLDFMEDEFKIGAGLVSNATQRQLSNIQSNMTLSAGAEQERAFVVADYAGRMAQMGLDLQKGRFAEMERRGEEVSDFFEQLATNEIFTNQYWDEVATETTYDTVTQAGMPSWMANILSDNEEFQKFVEHRYG